MPREIVDLQRNNLLLLLIVAALSLPPGTVAARIKVETLAAGLSYPWDLVFLPSGEVLVSERAGRLRRLVDGSLQPDPVSGLPDVLAQGEGGLLGLALHPDFLNNHWLYYAYTYETPEGSTLRLGRARYHNGALSDQEHLFEAAPPEKNFRHFGGRVIFDAKGYVYVTLGDRGHRPNAQDLNSHTGTTVRLTDSGGIPSDNPFIGRDSAKPEIFSYGHRNAQGIAIHPATGEVWQNEHGPQGGDEINIIKKGRNYGWPKISDGRNSDGSPISNRPYQRGLEPPLYSWSPSIAPSGMTFYQGSEFPQWQGDLFVGALAGQKLVRLKLDGNRITGEESTLEDRKERIRSVAIGPEGALWLLTDSSEGKLLRLTSDQSPPSPSRNDSVPGRD